MTIIDLQALLPLMILAAAPLMMMLSIAIRRNHLIVAGFGLIFPILAFCTILSRFADPAHSVGQLLIIDTFSMFYSALICAATAAVVLISYGYMEKQDLNREEFYILMMTATLGAVILVASRHFIALFMGLEILSVSLYALIAYHRTGETSIEAGLKYLILAAVSSAFLLFGMALIYADCGGMSFADLTRHLTSGNNLLSMTGMALLVVGVGFKLAVVPFHVWTPDVYQGAPAPVTAFIATVSKGGMLGLLLRFFNESGGHHFPGLIMIFSFIAIASMLAGNLLALLQDNIKRILAYSSIAHLGYMLVAFLAGGDSALEAATFYLVIYIITIIGAFGVIAVMSDSKREAELMQDYSGLFWRRPWLAATFTTQLLSLAGIPLTAGFIGKFYLLATGVNHTLWILVWILAVSSVIGLYYYLRIVVTLFNPAMQEKTETSIVLTPISMASTVVISLMSLLLIWFGVYPMPLIKAIQQILVE